ncbi:hypothetical protein Pedsa_3796 [Pseudopedobacter saltans DSM 12145]|uniref:T9SS C-terminal target domain-containing protein n=1 Tax=Pseudopedobacter saltans (strain ATCC 51119 / DSM 12145 / JCM 21818 / CCUG 39354 / LMG 10337 / NBRC 100064 / NCIMB 13643) TaxID=762903 RepID=F0S752_PSESL|nr:hypothetical protein [Pseudopedobacter saltans]ADY54325.1 hypothetical protein Pedsa_3796 [Pseudopedobacter saltans DSM 12145]
MKKIKFLALLAVLAISFSSCRKSNDEEQNIVKEPQEISGDITSNMKLTADRVWVLDGFVFVKNNAVLTIEPGTLIKAKVGQKSALVITQGSKIMAEGTAQKPIVFTSGRPVGERAPGDWGGIVLIGRASTNRTTPQAIEGGLGLTYGTEKIDDDNSGILKYVRIEYAGIGTNDSEINALTFYAVGSGTTIEHIQTSYANDDAYEFFGGTVNAKYLVAYATADDDFDFDFGYNGSIQFAVSLRDPKFVDAGDAGNGIECDNDKDGTTATPVTKPRLSNFTIIGPNNATGTASNHNYGNRWRRGTQFVFNNSILLGNQKGGFSIESDITANSYKNGTSEFKNNIISVVTAPFLSTSTALSATDMQTKALAEGNIIVPTAEIKINSPFSLTAPNFLPLTGSLALSGTFAATTNATAVNYRGAFGTTDWTAGWASWTPQTNVY